MKKKKLAWLVLAVLVVGIVGTFLYVRSAYPPERLRALLEPRVEEALGRPVSIGGASWSVMPLAVRLDDVRVHTDANETATLFELQALRFDLRWLPLLRREIAVRSLVLESPRVLLERSAEGRWNYEADAERAPAAEGRGAQTAATPVALRIESLRLQNGSLQLRDAVQDVQLVVPLEAELLLQTDRALRDVQLRGWIQSDALSGGEEGRLSAVRDVRVRFEPRLRADVADSTATVEGLRVEIEGLVLELEGRAALQNGAPVVHLRTRSEEFELAEILSLIPKNMAPDLEKVTARGSRRRS